MLNRDGNDSRYFSLKNTFEFKNFVDSEFQIFCQDKLLLLSFQLVKFMETMKDLFAFQEYIVVEKVPVIKILATYNGIH